MTDDHILVLAGAAGPDAAGRHPGASGTRRAARIAVLLHADRGRDPEPG